MFLKTEKVHRFKTELFRPGKVLKFNIVRMLMVQVSQSLSWTLNFGQIKLPEKSISSWSKHTKGSKEHYVTNIFISS